MGLVKRVEHSPSKRGGVLALVRGGRHTLREIADIMDMKYTTVVSIKSRGTAHNQSRSGRPEKFDERMLRRIDYHIRKSSITRRQSVDQIIRDLELDVSPKTLIKYLHRLGYRHCIARRRPLLTKRDMQRCLAFAKKFKHYTVEDFKRILWTDECAFKLYIIKHQDWVWRKPHEEFHGDCINRKKREGNGVMMWGAFRWGKIGPALFFELPKGKKVNSIVYHDQVLSGPLKNFWEEAKVDVEPIVMEDGAPVHQGINKKVREDLGMERWEHPPNSPDLNPIECIWHHIKHVLATEYHHITSQAELKEIVLRLWNEFADDQFNSLIESMPERIKAVIKAKGGCTKW
jgi:hypothetical protein